MKEEIKEILDDLRTYKDRYEYFLFNNLSFSDRDYKAKQLLDYITNLQEETERQSKAQVILDNQIAEMLKYKQRNEKAIEILKLCNSKCAKETISILKGDKDE